MDVKTFLQKNYTVKHVVYNNNDDKYQLEVQFYFNETNTIMTLTARPDCCDLNYFEFPYSLDVLIGSTIKNIFESLDPENAPAHHIVNNQDDDDYDDDVGLTFTIDIEFHYTSIINELKTYNDNWKTLPNDLIKMISTFLNDHVIFLRHNSSNGYYSGYLDISFSK